MISIIELDQTAKEPLYQQIYAAFSSRIMDGRIREGEYLPSKRVLCEMLAVSHSTVESAYQLLLAEGYIESSPRKGYRVLKVLALPKSTSPAKEAVPTDLSTAREDNQEKRKLDRFSTSAVETESFPFDSWGRLTRDILYTHPHLLERGEGQGDLELRKALKSFLFEYRGVTCREDQIVVGAGAVYLLDMLMKLLPEMESIGVESPGYPGLWRAGSFLGRKMVPIPLTDQGISVEELERHPDIRLCFTTPSHQFPTGVTMTVGLRSALLRWAERQEGYIIEDDYDSEFRYQTRPIPALQSMDGGRRVIFLGTFSRSIAPSIRVAYMVLPEELTVRYRAAFRGYDNSVSRLEQQVLARFLQSGMYSRHVRRTTRIYKERKEYLEKKLLEVFPAGWISGNEAGLHFLLHIPDLSKEDLISAAGKQGILLTALPSEETVLVIGFADMSREKTDRMCSSLKQAISDL